MRRFFAICTLLSIIFGATGLVLGQTGGSDEPFISDFPLAAQSRGRAGDKIILQGKNFGFPPGKVYFDDQEADVEAWSDFRITANVPPGKERVNIRIETHSGRKSNSRSFTYIPPPYLDYLWSSDDHGRPGDEIVLKGKYFGERPGKVFFDDQEADVKDWADGKIKAIVPPGRSGVDISIANAHGQKSNKRRFDYIPPPYLDYLWSSDDHGRPGDEIVLKGKYFGERPGKVFFDDQEADVKDWADRKIKVIVPPGRSGVDISITNAHGQKSNKRRFDYIPPPYLDYLWSSDDHGRPGDEIVLKGKYFGKRPGKVFFDNREAAVKDWADRKIKAIVPPGRSGVDISITNAHGQKSNKRRFKYLPDRK